MDSPARAPDGPVLGIETSGRVGSVALAVAGTVVAERVLSEPARHSAGLIPAVREVLAERGVGVGAVVGVVVGAGPGSFTGVKIAAAAAKGLSCSLGVPLYATSSLRAAAVAGETLSVASGGDGEIRYVLFDARGGRVYGACYDVGAGGAVEAVGPHGGTILDVLNGRPPRGAVFTGDGAVAHAGLIRAAGYEVRPPPAGVPGAGGVLYCCDWVAVDAAAWEPDYVREWRPG